MFNNNYSGPIHYAREINIMQHIYAWMCGALGLTAATAYYVASTPSIYLALFQHQPLIIGLCIAQVALVFAINLLVNKVSLPTLAALFMIYAISVGFTLSSIFLIFTYTSIFTTFIVAAGMFGAMAVYGSVTRSDLSSMSNILFMMLIGLLLAMLVNLYFKSSAFQLVISAIGVVVFTLLTAYDVQKLKRLTQELFADNQTMAKVAILGALALYLDFINLFLFLLRIVGVERRRE